MYNFVFKKKTAFPYKVQDWTNTAALILGLIGDDR